METPTAPSSSDRRPRAWAVSRHRSPHTEACAQAREHHPPAPHVRTQRFPCGVPRSLGGPSPVRSRVPRACASAASQVVSAPSRWGSRAEPCGPRATPFGLMCPSAEPHAQSDGRGVPLTQAGVRRWGGGRPHREGDGPLKESDAPLRAGLVRIGTGNRPRQPSGRPPLEPHRPLAQAGTPSPVCGPRRPVPGC